MPKYTAYRIVLCGDATGVDQVGVGKLLAEGMGVVRFTLCPARLDVSGDGETGAGSSSGAAIVTMTQHATSPTAMNSRRMSAVVGSYSAPLPVPCGSCPYRRDVPSGVWHTKEYKKLPEYDLDTPFQPPYVFLCHQVTGGLCAGWCGTHDMKHNLGLRIAEAIGRMDAATVDEAMAYTTDVPLFASGREACDHGLRDIKTPTLRAVLSQRSIRIKRKLSQ